MWTYFSVLVHWNVFESVFLILILMHICTGEIGHHWFRSWLGTDPAPSHGLNQCWLIVNWNPRIIQQFYSNTFDNVVRKMSVICSGFNVLSRTILCMRPTNERRRYNVTSSPIGMAHTQNDPCVIQKQSTWAFVSLLSQLWHNRLRQIHYVECWISSPWPDILTFPMKTNVLTLVLISIQELDIHQSGRHCQSLYY